MRVMSNAGDLGSKARWQREVQHSYIFND